MTAGSQFALGLAVALLIGVFAFSIPLLIYLAEGLHLVVDAPLPKLLVLLTRVSPWLPGLIAVLGSLGLLRKEARMSPGAAMRWNWAAVFAVVLLGGFMLFVCSMSMAMCLYSLNHRQWW